MTDKLFDLPALPHKPVEMDELEDNVAPEPTMQRIVLCLRK